MPEYQLWWKDEDRPVLSGLPVKTRGTYEEVSQTRAGQMYWRERTWIRLIPDKTISPPKKPVLPTTVELVITDVQVTKRFVNVPTSCPDCGSPFTFDELKHNLNVTYLQNQEIVSSIYSPEEDPHLDGIENEPAEQEGIIMFACSMCSGEPWSLKGKWEEKWEDPDNKRFQPPHFTMKDLKDKVILNVTLEQLAYVDAEAFFAGDEVERSRMAFENVMDTIKAQGPSAMTGFELVDTREI